MKIYSIFRILFQKILVSSVTDNFRAEIPSEHFLYQLNFLQQDSEQYIYS